MADVRFAAWAQPPLARAVGRVDRNGGPDGGGALPAGVVRPAVSVSGPQPFDVDGPALRLLGPDEVTGLAPGAVGRVEPAPGTADAVAEHLAAVELAVPELPWLLTPARAGDDQRLRPWIVLVVVETTYPDPPPVPVLDAPVDELPDLRDSWAWAHVQQPAPDATPPPGLERLVGRPVARLLCPRRLAPGRHYRACIVPAFARAGDGYGPAWDVRRPGRVRLPVYHQWTFSTAATSGSFADLVSRLVPARGVERDGLGRRLVDVSDPWPGDGPTPGAGGAPGWTVAVSGALRPPGPGPQPPDDEVQAYLTERLRRHLDAPADRLATTAAAGDRTGAVAPPIYGGRHLGRDRVDPPPPDGGPPAAPDWVAELNLSVPARVAAGLGAEYVRAHDEALMAAAWDQLGAVREANRLRATAALAGAVGEAVHRRHVATLTAGEAVALAAPAAARLRLADGPTLATEVAVSPLPDAAASAAFTRLLRPAGRVARVARTRPGSIVGRGLQGSVRVPDPAPVLARLDVVAGMATGSTDVVAVAGAARLAVDSTAAAWQVVRARAVAEVAAVNGLADAGGVVAAAVASIGPVDDRAVRGADVGALRTALAPQLAAVAEAMTTLAVTVGADAGGGGRAVTPFGVPVEAGTLRDQLVTALVPGDRLARRLASRVTVPPALDRPGLEPVMASPDFPVPAALALLVTDREWFLPGIGSFPVDRVAALEPDGRFIESYLAGLNHELQRELRWREYPTDGRGTAFRRFWPHPDGSVDADPMHTWRGRLGHNLARPAGGLTVLLVRGEVLRRFPDIVVAAAPATAPGRLDPDPARWEEPAFVVRLSDDTSLYAFARGADELVAAPGWFLVFQEHTYRLRFGFADGPAESFERWDQLGWPSSEPADPPAPGAVPTDGRGFARAGAAVAPPAGDTTGARWGTDAADVARIALRRPFRVAVPASALLIGTA